MTALLGLHAVVGLLVVAWGERLGRRALAVGAVPPAVALLWLLAKLGDVTNGEVLRETTSWVPALGLDIDLRLDGFAALMALLVAGIGVAVFAYGWRYFGASTPALGRLAGLLTLFAGSMLGVALAENVIVLYTCWELTSITSYLLIGNDHTYAKARAAALHALLVTSLGGLAMLGGLVVLAQSAGSYRLGDILEAHPSGTAVSVGLVLVLVGVFTKSAQYPFHGWLPGAMAAPTPVSAYLHAATMVKAGIYLLARLSPVFAALGFWRPLVITVGLVTMVAGGLRALRQYDLKLLLAFGTVSQLGFLTVLFGFGTPEAVAAGSVLLLAHGLFKAALFMVVGILDHQTGTRDLQLIPPLDGGWRAVTTVTVVSAASMAGLPLLVGFVAKESAYDAVLESSLGLDWLVLATLVAGSALTLAYSLRFVWGAFVAPHRRAAEGQLETVVSAPALAGAAEADASDGDDRYGYDEAETSRQPLSAAEIRPPSAAFLAAPAALAALTLLLGIVPGSLDSLMTAAAGALHEAVEPLHLALWHGVNAALVLSALTVALGAALFALREPVGRLLALGTAVPSSRDAYLLVLRMLSSSAARLTGIVQNGSLPIYTGVILLTAAVLPLSVLVSRTSWPGWPESAAEAPFLIVSALLIGSAIAAAAIRRRLSAVLFLGVTGYSMAALFVVRGAPDLALTQVAIETLSTVLFVLVLRRLPDRFERKSLPSLRVIRVAIATAVGVGIFVFALVAGASRTTDPVSNEMVQRAYPDGHGRNVVNVILVDFRGFDTLGEITVVAAAAIGAVALARAGRRPRPQDPSPVAEPALEAAGGR